MVYDPAAGHILLAGGSTSTDGGQSYTTFDDLWSYDGSWHALGSTGVSRSAMAIAYDSKRNRILAFGGTCPTCKTTEAGQYSDLLELKNGRWVAIGSIPSRPSTDSRMVYDARRDRLVLFGGTGRDFKRVGDTWEYDGATWTRFEGPGPQGRVDFAMTYDVARSRTVVFGGFGDSGTVPGETWEFDGAAWQRAASDGPSARVSVSMVYDSKRSRIILFGNGADTWSWDGRSWRKLSDVGPPVRYVGGLAYDAGRDRVVLFGGRNRRPSPDSHDTWEWDGVSWREIK